MNEKKAIVFPSLSLGLAVARALGRMGVPIIALYYKEKAVAQFSKYVVERVHIPQSHTNKKSVIKWLLDSGERHRGSLVIPADDQFVELCSKHKRALEAYYTVAVCEWNIARIALEKRRTYELAERAGIPHPRTRAPRSLEEAIAMAEAIGYPCILKPSESYKYQNVFRDKLAVVSSEKELIEAYKRANDRHLTVLLQESIPGDDSLNVNYCSYFSDGKPVAECTAQKLRMHPPRYGVARVAVSRYIPDIIEPGREILKAMGYNGLSLIEFKKDIRDGLYKVMDINIRPYLTATLAPECGVNLPYIMYRHMMYGDVPSFTKQKEGIYWIDLTKDAAHFFTSRSIERYPLRDYLKPYLGRKTFAILSFKDPLPFLEWMWYLLRYCVRKIVSSITRSLHKSQ